MSSESYGRSVPFTVSPGVEQQGWAIFEDGPAQGYVFNGRAEPGRVVLHRLPWFLRVTIAEPESGSAEGFGLEDARLDVLDLRDDEVREGERVAAVYRQRTWWHGRGEGYGAAYVVVEPVDLERCHPNEDWRRHVDEDLALRGWPPITGGAFACRR